MSGKKILVLGSRIPFPANDGGAVACMQTLRILSESDHVTYFSFNTRKHFVSDYNIRKEFDFCRVLSTPLDATPTIIGAIKAVLLFQNYNLSRFRSKKASQKLEALLQEEQFDAVIFENLFTSGFINIIERHRPQTVIYRAHNVEWQIWQKLALRNSGIRKVYLKKLAASFKKAEEKFIKKVNKIAAITSQDAVYFKTVNPSAQVVNLPVGIDPDSETPSIDFENNPTLYHLGSMEWLPNRDGLAWFIKEVWPQVLANVPKAQLHIAGRNLNTNDPEFAGAGISNHGEIQNASEFIKKYSICIVPIWSGSGLRIKTLEAMAAGRVVVTTQIGADGIEAINKKHWFIAENSVEFANCITEVLKNPETGNLVATEARQFIANHYALPQIALLWQSLGL